MFADISVIIPTYKGAHKIPNVLQALAKQKVPVAYQNFETIVVIDGSPDHTQTLLEKEHFGIKTLKVVTRENGGRAAARNTGAKNASGDLIIFLDDDMRPIEDCIAYHIQHHQQFSDSICVGGQLDDYQKAKKDIQKYRAHLSRKWGKLALGESGQIDTKQPYITAANCSMPKSLFFELGAFDERLRDTEDFDLAVRATQKEIPIYLKPEALGWHDDAVTCQSLIHRGRAYQKSYQYLKSLKPELYQQFNQYDYHPVSGFKKNIYNLITQKIWVKAIDHFNFFTIFPQKLRYKFYDILITGYIAYFPNKPI